MTEQELQTYIDHYTTADLDRIKLVWNGKYGQVHFPAQSEPPIPV